MFSMLVVQCNKLNGFLENWRKPATVSMWWHNRVQQMLKIWRGLKTWLRISKMPSLNTRFVLRPSVIISLSNSWIRHPCNRRHPKRVKSPR